MIVTILTKVLLPLSLAIIMFGMGMTLVPKVLHELQNIQKLHLSAL